MSLEMFVIIDFFDMIVSQVVKQFVKVCEEGGVVVFGCVFIFVIFVCNGVVEVVIDVVNDVFCEYFMWVIVFIIGDGELCLDVQICVGGDVGVSEVVVFCVYGDVVSNVESLIIGLLFFDVFVVVWWLEEVLILLVMLLFGCIVQCCIIDVVILFDVCDCFVLFGRMYVFGDIDFVWM